MRRLDSPRGHRQATLPGPGRAIGVDLGTQGVRVVLVDHDGLVVSRAHESWALDGADSVFHEQDPEMWWEATLRCVQAALCGHALADQVFLSVAATSGTLVTTDASRNPLRPAIMWNDKRSSREAGEANDALRGSELAKWCVFRPTFTLPKALWVRRNEPDVWRRARHLFSAGDWLVARLSGGAIVSDYTNALKWGYDLHRLRWPEAIEELGVARGTLQEVVAPGTPVAQLSPALASVLGLPRRTTIVAGLTDASAAQIAAGVVDEGRWVTTIGTGLSIKGVTATRLGDDSGAVYSHRRWDRGWIPTATSHCGADSITRRFPGADLAALTREASTLRFSSVLVLPLTTVGEFFPFWSPDARGFEVGKPASVADRFRGFLEGLAYIERLGMERLADLGVAALGPQVTMGGGAVNTEWMRLRASILGRPVTTPTEASSAFGVALVALAASPTAITELVIATVQHTTLIEPETQAQHDYESRYGAFLEELGDRGYFRAPAVQG